MYTCKNILVALVLPLLLLSCNGPDAETAEENEQALTGYRDYVTTFESDSLSEVEMRALQQSADDTTAWETQKANLQKEYDAQRKRIESNLEDMSPEQQKEVQDLDQRFKNALETHEHRYKDASHRYRLRRELLGLEIQADDMSDVTAANIGATYKRFVSNLKQHAANYEAREWEMIEGWWSALNSRYRMLEGDLKASTKQEVQEAQSQYQAIRPQEEPSENGERDSPQGKSRL